MSLIIGSHHPPARTKLASPPSAVSGSAQMPQDSMVNLKTYIVEDSPVIRENLIATLEEMVPLEVVGTAEDE